MNEPEFDPDRIEEHPPCVICQGPNDLGDMCAECAKEFNGYFNEYYEEDPHTKYGFDKPNER